MRAPITDKHLLEMMWERFPEIMKRGAEQPAQRTWVELDDVRIRGIFSYHGQTMTGKDLAYVRIIEEILKRNT